MPTLVKAQGVARDQTIDQRGIPVSFAIIRGSSGMARAVAVEKVGIETRTAITK
jgi:hypothetical protein